MVPEGSIYLGSGTDSGIAQGLKLKYANRHGLVAGATGTGKTVTVQIMAEAFSAAGVPVFVADVKGDVSGLSQPGSPHSKLEERAAILGLSDYAYAGSTCAFWDLFGTMGHAVRATVSDMGPLLLARMLISTQRKKGCSTSPLLWQMRKACRCLISRICARCWCLSGSTASN